MKCPRCAVHEALKKHIESKGWKWVQPENICSRCNGSNEVPDITHAYEKPRKELSGAEWVERESRDEWEHYITHERAID